MTSFDGGSYLEQYRLGLFCDLDVSIGDVTYHLHQLIVGTASGLFAKEIEKMKRPASGPSSAVSQPSSDSIIQNSSTSIISRMEKVGTRPWRGKLKCQVETPKCEAYWPPLIEYMYSGQGIQLNLENIVGWFCIANDLELTTLMNVLIEWIVTNVAKADLFHLLPQIILEPRAIQFLRYAISIIAKNFSDFVEADRFSRAPLTTSSSSHRKPQGSSASSSSSATSSSTAPLSPLLAGADSESNSFFFDWRVLPFDAMRDLLHDKNLFAASEEDVFQTIMHYLEKFKDGELDKTQITSLFETVRFERLDYSTLEAALAHPLVPKELLSRALMARLAGFEKPTPSASQPIPMPSSSQSNSIVVGSPPSQSMMPVPSASAPKSQISAVWTGSAAMADGIARDRRRQSYGRVFQWSSDFDTKGVLYYLGTREYRSEWQNPYTQKLVDVTWSSLEKGKPLAIFEREPGECWTQDVPSSWFTIDLGERRSIRLTAYTLRHGGSTKQDLIRNWTLKASIDGKEYVTLMRHKDDESLATPFATHTWPVPGAMQQAYRFFRVIQTGHNSSKHNFLSIGGVEFYGELIYDMRATQAPPTNTLPPLSPSNSALSLASQQSAAPVAVNVASAALTPSAASSSSS